MGWRVFKGVQIHGDTEGSNSFTVLLMHVRSNKIGVSMNLLVTMATAEPLCAYIV